VRLFSVCLVCDDRYSPRQGTEDEVDEVSEERMLKRRRRAAVVLDGVIKLL
jgi:hypothetical protein